jgi:hypothetical protein
MAVKNSGKNWQIGKSSTFMVHVVLFHPFRKKMARGPDGFFPAASSYLERPRIGRAKAPGNKWLVGG